MTQNRWQGSSGKEGKADGKETDQETHDDTVGGCATHRSGMQLSRMSYGARRENAPDVV